MNLQLKRKFKRKRVPYSTLEKLEEKEEDTSLIASPRNSLWDILLNADIAFSPKN